MNLIVVREAHIIIFLLDKRSNMQIKRTHDEFYANESYKSSPKESFKYIAHKLRQSLQTAGGGYSPHSILDIGCSNGDFLYFLGDIFPAAKLFGMDILPSLLQKCTDDFKALGREVPTLWVGDINTGENLGQERFDVVFLNGVIGIFDDLRLPLKHFSSLIGQNGVGYIWACFNPYDIDVLIKARPVGATHLESGWNLHSKQSVRNIFKDLGFACKFYDDFSIGIDIAKTADPLRTWTFKLENGKRAIINGLGLLHEFSLAEIRAI